MTRFSAEIESEDVVAAERSEVWRVLTTPDLIAELTPRVDHIEVKGDRWRWYLSGFSALGVTIQPSFTECMELTPEEHISYWHEPGSRKENAGADGEYRLSDVEGGTRVWIRICIHVDLPLPSAVGGAVRRVMLREMDRMGDAFARNLRREVGAG